jgi:hypothetical protein
MNPEYASAFAGKARRDRHVTCIHKRINTKSSSFKMFTRKDEYAFIRRDYLHENLRNYYMADGCKKEKGELDDYDEEENCIEAVLHQLTDCRTLNVYENSEALIR